MRIVYEFEDTCGDTLKLYSEEDSDGEVRIELCDKSPDPVGLFQFDLTTATALRDQLTKLIDAAHDIPL